MSEEWEGGQRQGIRWRRLLASLLVVAVGAAVWWAGRDGRDLPVETDDQPVAGDSEPPDVVVTSPVRAGSRWLCPNEFPVAASDDQYYVASYPRGGLPVRPEECFASSGRAAAAGHRRAPPPPGVVLSGGVYLVPAHHPQLRRCHELAAAVGFTVPCPRRLPSPAFGPSCTEARCQFREGVVIEQRSFVLPHDWCQACPARVVLTAVSEGGPRSLVTCRPGEQLRRLPAQPQLFERCPDGPAWIPGIGGHPHEGNVVYRWRREDGVTYAASVDGGTSFDNLLAVLRAVVEDIWYVTPPQ